MIELANSELRVDLLDPEADRERLGPRFCAGGFIWQVWDEHGAPLLSGPEWPNPAPSPFNGQGLPESFRHRTLDGRPLTWRGESGVALGAGELRLVPDGQVQLASPCHWEIIRERNYAEFTTNHAAAGFQYSVVRRIELEGRTIRSRSQLANLSATEPLELEWFAHPFFPLVDGVARAEIAPAASLPTNPGFTLRNSVLTQNRRFTSLTDGHMDRGLRLPPDRVLHATLVHPSLTQLTFETSFAPSACVIWGNDRTFSFEPYLALNLAPGAIQEWSLTYRFGASSGIATPNVTSRIAPSR
jgi:hypothetical protein